VKIRGDAPIAQAPYKFLLHHFSPSTMRGSRAIAKGLRPGYEYPAAHEEHKHQCLIHPVRHGILGVAFFPLNAMA
jgi:hypothetical protein